MERNERKKRNPPTVPGDHPHVHVSKESLDGAQVLRVRGGFDDVMNALHGRPAEQPPALPDNLDISQLPKYHGGCPGCGFMSILGEGIWRYRVLEKTRERWDNTTTYLARCKKCQTLMKATVDHND